MNPRTKNLAVVGGAVVVVGFVAVNTLMTPTPVPAHGAATDFSGSQSAPASPEAGLQTPDGIRAATASAPAGESGTSPLHPTSGSAGIAVEGAAPLPDDGRRSYAIGLHDLAGLPPDAAPGARLELWVTWEPPVTREPRLQKLIGDVVLERTIPGTVPEAPVTVLLSVPADRVGDLIYADGYGRLSVAAPPG